MAASTAKRAQVAERRAEAIRLKVAGLDWDAIAKQLGYASRGAACTDVRRAMEKNVAAEAMEVEVYRSLEIDRLDRLQAAHWTAATSRHPERDKEGNVILIDGKPWLGPPDPQAGELVRKCIMDRVKIRGLAAPQRHEVLSLEALDAQILAAEALLADNA